jgi:hypothetical protein
MIHLRRYSNICQGRLRTTTKTAHSVAHLPNQDLKKPKNEKENYEILREFR